MLTESHHNAAGVKDLIDDMVMYGDMRNSSSFRRAVMDFLLAFSEHVGEKYGLKSYSKFLRWVPYRENLYDDDSNLRDEFDLEQALYNTLSALNSFFVSFVKELTPEKQSSQDGDEDAFLFTTIRIARKQQKEYIQVVNDIIARKDEISDSLSEEDLTGIISALKRFKKAVVGYDFGSGILTKRQKKRKNNELYGSGARTNQPQMFSRFNKKDIERSKWGDWQKERDLSRFDPYDRKSKFKFKDDSEDF